MIVFWLVLTILFIIFATAKLKWHPFLVLILSAFLVALFYQVPLNTVAKTISDGFGGILGYIGLVIVFGTIIGLILEKNRCRHCDGGVCHQGFGATFPDFDHVYRRFCRLNPCIL